MRAFVVLLVLLPLVVPAAGAADAKPNLTAWIATVTEPDTPAKLWVGANNACSTPVDVAFHVDVYVDDVFFERLTMPALAACSGEDAFTSQSWSGHGEHTFTVVADPDGLVDEQVESDNTFTLTRDFTLQHPDLAMHVVSVSVKDWPLTRIVLTYRVCNEGDAASRRDAKAVVLLQTSRDRLVYGDSYLVVAVDTIHPLEPGACQQGTALVDDAGDVGQARDLAWVEQSDADPARDRNRDNDADQGTFFVGPQLG